MITVARRKALLILLAFVVVGVASVISAQTPAAPGDPIARANAMLARGEARAAVRLLEAEAAARRGDATRLAPVLRLQGYALVVLRCEADAERVFRALLAIAPGDAYGTLELAKRLHARAAWDEARLLYREILRRVPDHPTAARDLESMEADARAHAEVADRIATGKQRVWILAGITLLALSLLGWLAARYLRRAPAAGS